MTSARHGGHECPEEAASPCSFKHEIVLRATKRPHQTRERPGVEQRTAAQPERVIDVGIVRQQRCVGVVAQDVDAGIRKRLAERSDGGG